MYLYVPHRFIPIKWGPMTFRLNSQGVYSYTYIYIIYINVCCSIWFYVDDIVCSGSTWTVFIYDTKSVGKYTFISFHVGTYICICTYTCLHWMCTHTMYIYIYIAPEYARTFVPRSAKAWKSNPWPLQGGDWMDWMGWFTTKSFSWVYSVNRCE
jgi:hypothetical protein